MSNIISKNVLAEKIAADRFNGEVTPMTTDPTELLFAFNTYFKPTCDAIAKMIGVENFKGGFDEIQQLYRYVLEIDASTDEGKQRLLNAHTLAIQWEAADAYCKHEAEKLRWKPAEWWKFCWTQAEA